MAHSDHEHYREEIHHGEHPANYDHSEPKYSLLWIIGGATVVLLILTAIGIQLYYERTEEAVVYNRVLSQDSWQLRDLRNLEQQELTQYGYHDQEKGVVRIPIDQAMKLIAEEAAANRLRYPTNPYPVRTPEDLAATTPPVSPEGAAAVEQFQQQGVTSSPDVQHSVPQQPVR